MKTKRLALVAGFTALVGFGCATMNDAQVSERAVEIMKLSFQEHGQAKLDRLEQDDVQAVCSRVSPPPASPDDAAHLRMKMA